MNSRTLLVLDLDGERFGLDAGLVRETVWLPELTPPEETPPWIVGLFLLRGKVVAVADLCLRLGRPARRPKGSDQVVVLETAPTPLGLLVSEVLRVDSVPSGAILPPPLLGEAVDAASRLVTGAVRMGEDLVAILDPSRLAGRHWGPAPAGTVAARSFCPEATPEERSLFRARAAALREAPAWEEAEPLGLAVVELGGECFGVELAAAQEFCAISRLSPIPCCPPHILGTMNLRGELITLIDPRAALGLRPGEHGGKAVVARLGGQAVGVAVDEIHGVAYVRQEELRPPPPLLHGQWGAAIMGTAPYAGRTMTVLRLSELLAREEWVVNEDTGLR